MSAMKYDPIRLDAERYPFVLPVAPRFADMDILKHINNLSLAEYHEEARVRFLAELFGSNFLCRGRPYRQFLFRFGAGLVSGWRLRLSMRCGGGSCDGRRPGAVARRA